MPILPPQTGFSFPGLENLHNDIYPAISATRTPSLRQPHKVVLITGAGRGIGRAIALQYAHAHVKSLILCARTPTELSEVAQKIHAINPAISVSTHTVDVTDTAAVAALADAVTAREGRLDVLVNNAGASAPWATIGESDPGQWWGAFEVNLKGPFLFLHAFLPLLAATAEKDGTATHVVNVSSIGAHTVNPMASSYSTSKLALLRLTEFVDVEYGGKGVVAVGLHPGGVVTELSKDMEAVRPFLIDTADLCGGFVVWLTAKSRAWLAGRYVSATWDAEVLEGMKDDIVAGNKLKVTMDI